VNRRRGTRFVAIGLAAIVMGGAIGACGSDGPSKADIAAQDRDVTAANKEQKANVAKLKAALRVKWQARARARRAAALRHRRRPIATRRTVIVGGTSASSPDLCAPVRARFGGRSGRAERNWRRMQRKRVLYFLNLSC
jgi:hypothetical protein